MPAKTATLSVPLPATGLAAVVFDWAGTVIDFGSLAPMGAFVWLFKRHGVPITIDEARVPMGLPKWDHIRALGRQPRIAAAWLDRKGRPFDDRDVDALYEEFTPMNAAAVREHAELIPGVAEVIRALRARGIRVGSTTGYNRPIMEVLAPLAAGPRFRAGQPGLCRRCAAEPAESAGHVPLFPRPRRLAGAPGAEGR